MFQQNLQSKNKSHMYMFTLSQNKSGLYRNNIQHFIHIIRFVLFHNTPIAAWFGMRPLESPLQNVSLLLLYTMKAQIRVVAGTCFLQTVTLSRQGQRLAKYSDLSVTFEQGMQPCSLCQYLFISRFMLILQHYMCVRSLHSTQMQISLLLCLNDLCCVVDVTLPHVLMWKKQAASIMFIFLKGDIGNKNLKK